MFSCQEQPRIDSAGATAHSAMSVPVAASCCDYSVAQLLRVKACIPKTVGSAVFAQASAWCERSTI